MRSSIEENGYHQKKYKGVRRRKWGKWVSEIRVPGSQERLWLGSYATPEAAAVAHDVAFYCLRRPLSLDALNFPCISARLNSADMSPRSIQKAASDAGMEIDARQMINANISSMDHETGDNVTHDQGFETQFCDDNQCRNFGTCKEEELTISVEDYLK